MQLAAVFASSAKGENRNLPPNEESRPGGGGGNTTSSSARSDLSQPCHVHEERLSRSTSKLSIGAVRLSQRLVLQALGIRGFQSITHAVCVCESQLQINYESQTTWKGGHPNHQEGHRPCPAFCTQSVAACSGRRPIPGCTYNAFLRSWARLQIRPGKFTADGSDEQRLMMTAPSSCQCAHLVLRVALQALCLRHKSELFMDSSSLASCCRDR